MRKYCNNGDFNMKVLIVAKSDWANMAYKYQESLALIRGVQSNNQFAESFEVIRWNEK
jgi:hypothetical protein